MVAIVGASCEIEATSPPENGPVIERVVSDAPTTLAPTTTAAALPQSELSGSIQLEGPAPAVPDATGPSPTSTPIAPATTAAPIADGDPGDEATIAVLFSNHADRTDPAHLHDAVIAQDVRVFAEVQGLEPIRLEWLINGIVYRIDELDAPYDMVRAVDGVPGSLSVAFLGDGTHEITARAVLATSDGGVWSPAIDALQVTVNFAVDAPSVPATTTIPIAPAPASSPGSTTTTTAAPAPPPPSVATGVPDCAPSSASQVGWRGAGLTEADLTPMSGRIVLGDNAVLENFDLAGYIEIDGDNVTVRNGRIRANGDTPSWGGVIHVLGDDALIEGVELDGQGASSNGIFVHADLGGGYVARSIDIHGFGSDAFKVLENTVLDRVYAHDRQGLNAGAHADVAQLGNWRAGASLTITCSNLDWGIPAGFGPSHVSNGTVSGGQGIWIADYWLPTLEIRDTRIIAVGFPLGLKIDTRLVMCNVQVGSDMGWGAIHPGFGALPASTVAWSVHDAYSGAAIDPIATPTTSC